MVAHVVEDEVVAGSALPEILLGVVDDVVGPDRRGPAPRSSCWSRPVTSAPNAFAICTANVPTPPDAPLIEDLLPGLEMPLSRRSWRAVVADTPTAAACSKVRLAGLVDEAGPRLADAYSAKAPVHQPNTSSPGRRPFTSLPTASTVPAMSVPGTWFFGLRRPVAIE